ncbi:MAG: tRNA (adenosine(37)-N6)-dimethylallyltransferase MiaA [Ruminococcus sp.]|jgi:tRNA dimethylallyltransferase|nr:tRNA (adenosine(37)-N6)-dimethylallyltransferase MiaA [Ruminococcus sp.]
MEKINVIAVVGPTASGKTALGVYLAEKCGGEVISADSMQIYKGLDITTAKPTAEEMRGIPHHLISVVPRSQKFSVADYVNFAGEKILEVKKRNKLPIIVGGTGLYIDSLLNNIKFGAVKCDQKLRDELKRDAETFGGAYLLERLQKYDRETAERLHPNNITRIIRAIEVYELTGITMTETVKKSREHISPYNVFYLGINCDDRNLLYEKINARVDKMVKNGMTEECKECYETNPIAGTAGQAIGYKELIPYFDGKSSLSECIDKIKQETRRYAKRQLTWFRRNSQICRVYNSEDIKIKEILNFF